MIGPPVSPERHWNTWDAAHPASLVHLPSRLALRLAAYSAREERYSDFPAGPATRLLEHTADAGYVAAELELAGTRLRFEVAKPDPFALAARLTVVGAAEWALRFWLLLEVGFLEPGGRVRLEAPADPYAHPALVRTRARSLRGCLVPSARPTYAGLYDDLGELRDELEQGGYYRPHPEQPDGRWAVLRFNGQSQATTRLALALATDDAAAERRARELLPEVDALVDQRAVAARDGSEPARAVRDVVAWNTVLDDANLRWFTILTRNWTQSKFGGWGVWLDDVLLHALLAACAGDAQTARANLEVALTGQQPAGNLACLLTAYTEWVDRSQPPIAAYVLLRVYLRTGDRALLEQAYPTLRRAHDWWFEHRDGNGNGVLEHGSSPTGDGTFVHTKQGALDEAAMDNLPLFDHAEFDEDAHTLDLEEVGLNSLVVLDGQMLARIAELLGRGEDAAELTQRAGALAQRVRERLWDPQREVFAARRWSGEWVSSLAPTSFYPLLAGIATPEQANALVRKHLLDPERFWGPRPLPSSAYDDPATPDDVYWRGRIWPPLVFLCWEGLRRAGYASEAAELAERAWALFASEWSERRRCRENYKLDPDADPEVDDSDGFYTWGALLALIPLLEAGDASPWSGLTLAPGGEVTCDGVRWEMRDDGVIERGGKPLLELSQPVAVSGLEAGTVIAFTADVPEGGLDVRVVGGERYHLEAGYARFTSERA